MIKTKKLSYGRPLDRKLRRAYDIRWREFTSVDDYQIHDRCLCTGILSTFGRAMVDHLWRAVHLIINYYSYCTKEADEHLASDS